MRSLWLLFLLCNPAFCTLSDSTVWEVRTAGTDTNGGGFVTGSSGTDMSQFNNKNAASCTQCQSATVNISTTDAVTNGTTTITSATANFSSAIVGNIIYVTGGTGSITAAWYQVTTFTNATTILVDRSTGLTTGTGATMNIGGALATVNQAVTNMTSASPGMTAYVKGGTAYTRTTTMTLAQTALKFIGYTTTRGDNGQATITTATNNTSLFTYAGTSEIQFQNFIFSSTAGTPGSGFINTNASYTMSLSFINCQFTGLANGITAPSGSGVEFYPLYLQNCYLNANTTGITIASGTNSFVITDSTQFAANTNGINSSSGTNFFVLRNSIFYNQSSRGVLITSANATVIVQNSAFVGNTSDGLGMTSGSTATVQVSVINTIFDSNGGYGINFATAPFLPFLEFNAPRNNTSGSYNNVASTNDISITASPFVSPSGNNFALNNTASAGAALRGAGFPGTLQAGGSGTIDVGPIQHTAAAGAGQSGYPILQ